MTALTKLFRTTAFKLSLAYLVITSIWAALVVFSIGWNVSALVKEQVTTTVDNDLASLSEQYSEGGLTRLVALIDQRVRQPGAGLYLVTTHAGEPLVGNLSALPAGTLDAGSVVETEYRVKGQERRALARAVALSAGFRLLVGHDLGEAEALTPILWRAFLNSLIWLALVGTIGGLAVARRVLTRVDRINAEARRIVDSDLTGRLPLTGSGDELDRLVSNINAMLDRIATLVAGVKEVSDNVAHDLKTPLTRLRARAEQTLRVGRNAADYRDALERVIEDADGMMRIFNALLMIARAEAGAGRDGMRDFDVADVTSDVGELYEPLADLKGIRLDGQIEPNLVVHGNRELIGQTLANLVDNALKYGADEKSGGSATELGCTIPAQLSERPLSDEAQGTARDNVVTLSARRVGLFIEIAVADSGPGIDALDRTRVTERFVRLENSRSQPGTGLGLSLVEAVVRLHNGELLLDDNKPGLRVTVRLPAVPRGLVSAPALPIASRERVNAPN